MFCLIYWRSICFENVFEINFSINAYWGKDDSSILSLKHSINAVSFSIFVWLWFCEFFGRVWMKEEATAMS